MGYGMAVENSLNPKDPPRIDASFVKKYLGEEEGVTRVLSQDVFGKCSLPTIQCKF